MSRKTKSTAPQESPSLDNAPKVDTPAEALRPFTASDSPHDGPIAEEPPPAEESQESAAVAKKRGRPSGSSTRKSAKATDTGVDKFEPTPAEIENAKDMTELVLFMPTEMFFDFDSPKIDLQNKIARLEARLWKKHVSASVSDEYALVGLLAIWLLTNIAAKMFGAKKEAGNGQRANGNIRPQADGKNPLDDPLFKRTD